MVEGSFSAPGARNALENPSQHMHMKWEETSAILQRNCSRRDLDEARQIVSYDAVGGFVTQLPLTTMSSSTLIARLRTLSIPASNYLSLLDNCSDEHVSQTQYFWGMLCLLLRAAVEAASTFEQTIGMLIKLGEALDPFKTISTAILSKSGLGPDLIDIFVDIFTVWARLLKFLRRHPNMGPAEKSAWGEIRLDFDNLCTRTSERATAITSRPDEVVLSQASLLENLETLSMIGTDQDTTSVDTLNDGRFPCHYVPFLRNNVFFGRNEELKKIRSELCDGNRQQFRCYALYGTGGIGKTQTALAFAFDRVDAGSPLVIWIDCETGLSAGRSFQEVARLLQLPEHTEDEASDKNRFAVLSWLRRTNVDWVMIIDNVEDLQLFKKSFPTADRGAVLVTTRRRVVMSDFHFDGLDLNQFSKEEGAKFILQIVGQRDYKPADFAAAEQLSEMLDGLALALTIMATQIKLRKISIPKFVRLYSKRSKELNLSSQDAGVVGRKQSLETCWKASFDYLDLQARHMLSVISFIAPDKIPDVLFLYDENEDEDVVAAENYDEGEHTADAPPSHLEFCTEWGMEVALDSLLDTALVKRDISAGLSIHRLIQEEFRRYLDADERNVSKSDQRMIEKRLAFKMASTLLRRKIPEHINGLPLRKHWPVFKKYIPHVLFLCRRWQEYKFLPDGESMKDFLELSCPCGWYLMECGAWQEEAELMRTAMAICEDKEGLVYAHLANSLGCSEMERGRVGVSRPYMDKSFEIRKRLLPADHEEIANCLNNYANLILQEFLPGAAQTACEMYMEVIKIDDTKPEEESDLVFHLPHINLGRARRVLKEYDQSIYHNERARYYSIKQFGGENHFDALADYQNGSTYFDMGNLSEAEKSWRRALRIFKGHNAQHPNSFFAEMKLAELESLKGNHAEAIETFKRVLVTAQLNEMNKGDKGEIARIMRKFAEVYQRAGDVAASQQYHSMAEGYRRVLQGERYATLPDCDQSYCIQIFHAYW